MQVLSFRPACMILCFMQQTITLSTPAPPAADLYDITPQVEAIVAESGVQTGLVNVYVQGATAGIMMLFI